MDEEKIWEDEYLIDLLVQGNQLFGTKTIRVFFLTSDRSDVEYSTK